MNLLTINRSRASVVVGVDFGTTFSGFAFARISEPDKVNTFYEWPHLGAAGGGHYCKTMTSLLYQTGHSSGSYVLQDWGYSALLKHAAGRTKSSRPQQICSSEDISGVAANILPLVPAEDSAELTVRYFLTLFKLHLVADQSERTSAADLPEGLTPRRVISDYLRKLSEFIMKTLQSHMGSHITMEDVQWCLTVPAIWDDRAKQEMKTCASMAGMTRGPDCAPGSMDTASPHPVMIVIEPEAASLYCQRKVQFPFDSGDQLLIVDVGGGTVDLVLHEKIGASASLKVREVSPSSGGLFGGSYVDKAFFDFLSCKIRCFPEFARAQTESVLKLKGWWENTKYGFDGDLNFSSDLELPARLAHAWEEDEKSHNKFSNKSNYDAIELSLDDMLSLFDPVVDGILGLIESKLLEGTNVKAMMIVGGFSGSPYLIKRIRREFFTRVGTIVVPDEPGAAICCCAVYYGIYGADIIMSRISKKTYGINTARPFNFQTDPPRLMFQDDYGEPFCTNIFSVYSRRNGDVPLDHRVSHTYCPVYKNQSEMSISLFSTLDSNPKYVCDPGVTKEGTFLVTFPSANELGQEPEVLISIYFGRTLIEVEATGQNFGSGEKFKMPPVRFEKSFE